MDRITTIKSSTLEGINHQLDGLTTTIKKVRDARLTQADDNEFVLILIYKLNKRAKRDAKKAKKVLLNVGDIA